MDNSGSSSFLQGSGGLQDQNSVSQSPNASSVQANGDPFASGTPAGGGQAVLGQSAGIIVPNVAAQQTTVQNQETQISSGSQVSPSILIFLIVVISISIIYALKRKKPTVATEKPLPDDLVPQLNPKKSTRNRKKKKKKPNHH